MRSNRMHTIMIVDDEESIRKLLVSMFESDYYTISAASVQEAKQLMTEVVKVHVVISDNRIGAERDTEFVKWVKEKFEEVVFLLITGTGPKDLTEEDRKLIGEKNIFAKPLDLLALAERVRRKLRK